MSPEKQKALFDKYPDIFRERNLPMTETCMCWGICCDEGWYNLLDFLCASLSLLRRHTGLEIVFRQTKEKFGTLRVYWQLNTFPIGSTSEEQKSWWDIVDALVHEAEHRSAQTCEITGGYGSLCMRDGWYKTLCKEKAKKMGYMTAEEWQKLREEVQKG